MVDVEAGFRCLDCGADTSAMGEYYMVHRAVWRTAVPNRRGMLCIGCLEERLGRRLSSADFTRCMLNDYGGIKRSARLRDRLQAPAYV